MREELTKLAPFIAEKIKEANELVPVVTEESGLQHDSLRAKLSVGASWWLELFGSYTLRLRLRVFLEPDGRQQIKMRGAAESSRSEGKGFSR
eukprot:535294-Amphidinium_carterae.1